MWVVGTAGHVDHGKSTLVEALTGTHPDRLKEEKQREMTIELGFAWLNLPSGETVGIVDVPGHRDFIENMLAGVGGIDAVLFIVAADEGVMPQTREHLAILDLLQVKTGIIVLTKVDLVPDPEWLDLVEQEVRDFCAGTILQEAPLVRVSAVKGEGIAELKQVLAERLSETPAKADLGKPRLSVDRVFTVAGYGTVVTGTLVDGSFSLGDDIQVLPAGLTGRIRGVQTYNQKVSSAPPGSRTALNIAGIDRDKVIRGDVITLPGGYQPTQRLDAQVRMLKDAAVELVHDEHVKFFLGATEAEGRIRVLGTGKISPGEEGYVQIEFKSPVVAVAGDRFILRIPSPPATIAGGVVLDAQPAGRYRLNDPQTLARLVQLTISNPEEDLLHTLSRRGIVSLEEAKASARLGEEQAQRVIIDLIARDALITFNDEPFTNETRLISAASLRRVTDQAVTILNSYHRENPTRLGMGREELKTRLGLRSGDFALLLPHWFHQGQLAQEGGLLRLPEHTVNFTPAQQKKVQELMRMFAEMPFTPPSFDESLTIAGELLLNAMIESGNLVRVNTDVLFSREAVSRMSSFIRQRAEDPVPFSVGEFRDHFKTSRKYALAFLEHLDNLKATQRVGEGRRLIHPENLP